MTTTIDLKQLELATAFTVAWGSEENVIDAWEAGTLRPDLFTDAGHQTIVAAVSGLIAAGEAPLHDVIHDALTSNGRDLWDAARLHAVPGGRAALLAVMPDKDDEHRYQALPILLARLIDEVTI